MVFASVVYMRLNFLCCNFYYINLISDFLFKRRRLVFFHLNTGFVIFRSRSEWFCTFFYFFHFIRSSFVSFSNGSHSNDAGWVSFHCHFLIGYSIIHRDVCNLNVDVIFVERGNNYCKNEKFSFRTFDQICMLSCMFHKYL